MGDSSVTTCPERSSQSLPTIEASVLERPSPAGLATSTRPRRRASSSSARGSSSASSGRGGGTRWKTPAMDERCR
jgi:hypothetical protein